MLSVLGICLCLGSPNEASAGALDRLHRILTVEASKNGGLVDREAALRHLRDLGTIDEAWWHSGYLKLDGNWRSYEAAVRQVSANKLMDEYVARRSRSETPKQVLALARWCRKKGLDHHFRIHKIQALGADRGIVEVREAKDIGLVDVNGHWLTPSAAERTERELDFHRQSFKRFGKICRSISAKLDRSTKKANEALGLLAKITEEDALPAIDRFIGQRGRNGSRHAVSAFGQVPTVRSSVLLTKYSIYANNSAVRSAAAKKLSKRRLSHFVPLLLQLLSTEIEKIESPKQYNPFADVFGRRTNYTFENTYRRETRDSVATLNSTIDVSPMEFQIQVADGEIVDQRYRRVDYREARDRAEEASQSAILNRFGRSIEDVNEGIRALNTRVINVLSEVSDQSAEDPRYWWNWWSNRVGEEPPEKNVIEVEEIERQLPITRVRVRERCECFAAGTLVLTDRGRRPIESLIAGDRVLAQSIRSGELEFKVVEQPTVRARAVPTVQLTLEDETVVCTPGHEVWQIGVGWVRAKELQPGDRIRTLKGSVTVRSIRGGLPQLTYNLVVEGHHNYFVGQSAFLAHDVNTATPTDNIAPGMSRFDVK